jgi:sugar/nucleoside kinase (ribokinase family)
MIDVVSIGAATVDIFVKSPSLKLDGPTLGVPASSKNEISQGLICSGGGATNSSASFSRLGLKSVCVSLFGNDPLSQYVINDLTSFQVDTSLLVRPKKETTDYSVILIAPDGTRSIFTNRGPSRLESDQINWDKIVSTGWLYLTSLEGNLDLLEKIIGFASEHSLKIAFNPGSRELSQAPRLSPLFSHLDFLLLNRQESEELIGLEMNQPNYWEKILSLGSKITAITDGRNGAYVLSAAEKLYSPIIATPTVDETGAGDSFGSALVSGLIRQLSLSDALFWGIKNSASVVSSIGAKTGLLSLDEIKI